jgi:hypothetical protein
MRIGNAKAPDWQVYGLLLLTLIPSSCHRTPGPETPITREVMDAGGGDPAVVSPQAMRRWFLEHRRFAEHISGECRAVREHPLGWSDTTEGKACAAALETEAQHAGRDREGIQ